MTTDKARVGVIGVGQIGKYHVSNYSKIPNAELVAVADVNEAEARRVAIAASMAAHPAAAWPWRLPIIRHIRAVVANYRINRHYEAWSSIGMLPVNADFDYAIRDAIWRGDK